MKASSLTFADTIPAEKRCRVCGSNATVRSHLFPRALSHDIRGSAKHVVTLTPSALGPKFHQSGEWSDRILCREHEEVAHSAEKYAIAFCRRFNDAVAALGRPLSVDVSNPEPSFLVLFAHIVVWRHAAAWPHLERSLGPYFSRIQETIFEAADPLEVMVMDPGHVRSGERALLGLCPSKIVVGSRRGYRFDIGGLSFILKTDKRPYQWPLGGELLANNNPIRVLLHDPVEVHKNPQLIRGLMNGSLTPER